MGDWNRLPLNALGIVISFLNEMDVRVLALEPPCVSKGWRQPCEGLHAKIDISELTPERRCYDAEPIPDGLIDYLIRRFPKTVSIKLCGGDEALTMVSKGFPLLASLQCHGEFTDVGNLVEIEVQVCESCEGT